MIKHIINTFVAIAACLGLAAFILVLVKKQKYQTKEPLTTTSCGKLDDKSKNIKKYNVGGNDNIDVNKVSRNVEGYKEKCYPVKRGGKTVNLCVQMLR
jgi:hypothetical protein